MKLWLVKLVGWGGTGTKLVALADDDEGHHDVVLQFWDKWREFQKALFYFKKTLLFWKHVFRGADYGPS